MIGYTTRPLINPPVKSIQRGVMNTSSVTILAVDVSKTRISLLSSYSSSSRVTILGLQHGRSTWAIYLGDETTLEAVEDVWTQASCRPRLEL